MKKNFSPAKAHRPFMPWMTGDFERVQNIRHHFPTPFLLLCKLVGVTPAKMITDLADNLGGAAWNREGRKEAKSHLVNYFIAHGYGQDHFQKQSCGLFSVTSTQWDDSFHGRIHRW